MRVDRRSADEVLLHLEAAKPVEQLAGRGHDLGADAIAREGDDAMRLSHGVPRR